MNLAKNLRKYFRRRFWVTNILKKKGIFIMKKQKKVIFIFLVVSLLVLVFSLTGVAADSKTLKLGNIQNIDNPHHLACQKFAQLVESKTNGSLKVEIFPNSQLGNALTQITMVKMGTLDMFVDGLGWYGQFIGEYNIIATAYAFKDINNLIRFLEGPIGQEMAEKLRKQHGLRILSQIWTRPVRNLFARKPIYSIDDVKDLKIRVPELASYIEPWKAMGASPTPIAWNELYLALQQGVVEAAEAPTDNYYTQRLHEVAKYLMLTRHLCETAGLIINDKLFNSLSADEQKALYDAAKEAGVYNDQLFIKREKEVMEKLKNEGVTIIEVDVSGFYNAAKEVPYILENNGAWEKGFYDRILKMMKE